MLVLGLISMTGCSNQYEDDYFVYWKGKSGDEKVYYIRGLTEKGREQEYLILPTEVNGFKTKLKEGSFGPIYGDITLKSQTLFVPSYFTYISELCFRFNDENSKLIVFSNDLKKVDLSDVLNEKKYM